MVRVAIDAMGGDFGATPILEGVVDAMREFEFLPILVGDEKEILSKLPTSLHEKVQIIHTTDVIDMQESATDALKRKESTIYIATDLVKNNQADALVSAGHSGATMSLATLRIGRIKGVLRPAIATLMPTQKSSKVLVLDVGANVDCDSDNLVQFAIMGEAYAKGLFNIPKPKIGLIANGEEPSKGNKLVKETHQKLKNIQGMNFIGNIEGGDIFKGDVDVAICDGFVGNTILKTSEGIANSMMFLLKQFIMQSFLAKIGAMLSKGAFKKLKKELDYAEYGGAPLIGINGCAIVSHGKSNPKAIKSAISQAIKFVNSGVNTDILEHIQN